MKSYEKDEISTLPDKYRPVGAWGYFGYTILFSLPFIGFIALLICALSGGNVNRRSFARSYFCWFIIGLIIVIIAVVAVIIMSGGIAGLQEKIQMILEQLQQGA